MKDLQIGLKESKNHWDRCVAQAKFYARNVRRNDVSPELLIRCYLEGPEFNTEWRSELFKIAMDEYHGGSYVD